MGLSHRSRADFSCQERSTSHGLLRRCEIVVDYCIRHVQHLACVIPDDVVYLSRRDSVVQQVKIYRSRRNAAMLPGKKEGQIEMQSIYQKLTILAFLSLAILAVKSTNVGATHIMEECGDAIDFCENGTPGVPGEWVADGECIRGQWGPPLYAVDPPILWEECPYHCQYTENVASYSWCGWHGELPCPTFPSGCS